MKESKPNRLTKKPLKPNETLRWRGGTDLKT